MESHKPLISIIIPCFNRAHVISETLESIIAQTYTNWECLVIDDGSDDATESVVLDYIKLDKRFRYYKRPAHRLKGGNAARNYGYEKCNGDYVNWLDSDDLLKSNHFELHLDIHKKNNVDATVSNALRFMHTDYKKVVPWSVIHPVNDRILETIERKIAWQTGAVLWKKSSIIGKPFHETLISSQEWTFHLHQLIYGRKFMTLSETTVLVRDHVNRIGRIGGYNKIYATFQSRLLILNLLYKQDQLNITFEKALLKSMCSNLIRALNEKENLLTFRMSIALIKNIYKLKSWHKIPRIVFMATPIYFIFGKGEKLFYV